MITKHELDKLEYSVRIAQKAYDTNKRLLKSNCTLLETIKKQSKQGIVKQAVYQSYKASTKRVRNHYLWQVVENKKAYKEVNKAYHQLLNDYQAQESKIEIEIAMDVLSKLTIDQKNALKSNWHLVK